MNNALEIVFPNILIVFASTIGFLRWHFQSRIYVLFAGFLASLFSASYFYILNIPTAYLIGFATSLSTLMVIPFPNLPLWIKFLIGLLAYGLGVYFFGFTLLSLFPVLGFTLGRIASTLKEPCAMKECYWGSSLMWFLFNFLNHTWMAMVMEMINLMSNGLAIWQENKKRNDIKNGLIIKEPETIIEDLSIPSIKL